MPGDGPLAPPVTRDADGGMVRSPEKLRIGQPGLPHSDVGYPTWNADMPLRRRRQDAESCTV